MALGNEIRSFETAHRSRRWFLTSVASILGFLVLSLCVAAIILLRRGLQPKFANIVGGSMEPHLRGPRLLWTPADSVYTSCYSLDSIKPNQPLPCQVSGEYDMAFDFDVAVASKSNVLPGDTVQYFHWKRVEAQRKAASHQAKKYENAGFRGLVRGDLVVIQSPDTSIREVKRVVGFPGEVVDIKDGDLWISGERWKRDMKSALTQSILVESSDPTLDSFFGLGFWFHGEQRLTTPFKMMADQTSPEQNMLPVDSAEFRLKDRPDLLNDLRWNAHDSHELVPVNDFGVAFQIEALSQDWQLAITLQSAHGTWQTILDGKGNDISVSTGQSEGKSSEVSDHEARWIIVMRCDGQGWVGDQQSEWIREMLPEPDDDEMEGTVLEQNTSPIMIQCHQGTVSIRQWLIFRDIHYRGQGDSIYQRLQALDGIVVLGDNVSLSSDSRQRWPDGLPLESIRGVVELKDTGIPSLLQQRD